MTGKPPTRREEIVGPGRNSPDGHGGDTPGREAEICRIGGGVWAKSFEPAGGDEGQGFAKLTLFKLINIKLYNVMF